MQIEAFAPAKVNLYLHITGRRADGYHLVDSLVAFADIGDRVIAEPADGFSLAVNGPEASGLASAGNDNLVLRAARLLAAHLRIAGGAKLQALAVGLGADVPACMGGRAVWVGGIGEWIEPAAALPNAGILLANPRRQLPTASVFGARHGRYGKPGRFAPMPADASGLAQILTHRRNDLTEAAIGLIPEIGIVLARLSALPGALLARMSGSGATCFALFADRRAAESARNAITAAEPGWWSAAGAFVAADELSG